MTGITRRGRPGRARSRTPRAAPTTRCRRRHVISTMPMRELVHTITPPPPPEVLAAADDLHYRDYLTVALVVPESRSFPDNWIYIHAPDVEVGRIQNYGSWSPYLVKDGRTCLGLEYFVFEGDDMWNMADDELIALGTKELVALGLAAPGDVEGGYVVRVPKAYPYYDFTYKANVETIRKCFETEAPERPPGRSQRHAQVQQPGPLHVHGHADGGEHVRRRPRHLVGQRRRGVPRGGVDRDGTPRCCRAAPSCHGRHAQTWLGTRRGRRRRRRPWMTLPAAGLLYLALGFVLWVHAWTQGASTHTLCGCGDPALFLWFFQWPATALAHAAEPVLLDGPLPPGRHQPVGPDLGARPEHPAGAGHVDLGPGGSLERGLDPHARADRLLRVRGAAALGAWTPGRLRRRPALRLLALRADQPGVRPPDDGGAHAAAADPGRARRDPGPPAPQARSGPASCWACCCSPSSSCPPSCWPSCVVVVLVCRGRRWCWSTLVDEPGRPAGRLPHAAGALAVGSAVGAGSCWSARSGSRSRARPICRA